MTVALILKLLVVVFFLIMFLRGSRLVWGVGLLTVTSAVLLDAILGTFGRQALMDELGFFFDVIAGALFAGGAVWLWGLLRPLTAVDRTVAPPPAATAPPARPPAARRPAEKSDAAFDRQMLLDQIRQRFGPDDVLDLIFDLGYSENDVINPRQEFTATIFRVMDLAEQHGHGGALALAVERILVPPGPEKLPRLEKLSVDSPPTVLRHYLLAHYSLAQLAQMAQALAIDWEQIPGSGKKQKVREFLLHLYRRGRLADFLALLTASAAPQDAPVTQNT